MSDMKRYSVGNCEMNENKKGSYVHVSAVLAWLDDLTDDDNPTVIREKVESLQMKLGDL